jgi:hypothetical protein
MSQPRKSDLRRFYSRAGHRCEYCHAPESFFPHRLCLDHILPEGRGWPTSLKNLALCCYGCQQQKLAFEVGLDPMTTKRPARANRRVLRGDLEVRSRWWRRRSRLSGEGWNRLHAA